MRFTAHLTRTSKENVKDDVSRNAQLLVRAGYVHKLMAGVYSFLPMGLRVLSRIEQIVREEMDALGAQEILMPALQPKEVWEQTGRWSSVDVLFKLMGAGERELALGPTHEEVVTPLVGGYLQSYRDFPRAVYQLQTKFRNEARAKSGLLRGREFRMKDMYSFHTNQGDLDAFYERATAAYHRVYERCGLGAITLLTVASGGVFSKYSHEFQTITPYGEDVVYRVPGQKLAINKEIIGDTAALAELVPGYRAGDEKQFEELKAIEVGNIFKLGSRFSDACGVKFTDASGKEGTVLMGCYGIGPSRVMGTVAECLSDDKGLVWPTNIAPYRVHLISLARDEAESAQANTIYETLTSHGVETLFDDRPGVQAGEKFNDADLIGLPYRIVVSKKTLAAGGVEWKPRAANSDGQQVVPVVCPLEQAIAQSR